MLHRSHTRAAFTLIELGIVIVIIGLLVGGILGGQSLIRASELKSVVSDFQKYKGAVVQFQDQYNALPGDMPNATSYWGTDSDGCPENTARIAKIATCDGNGNGRIGPTGASGGGAVNEELERPRAWQQLSNAGLVNGLYTGVSGASAGILDMVPGENIPKNRIGTAGFTLTYNGSPSGHAAYYDGNYGHMIAFGSQLATDFATAGIITPREAWSVDTKMDDGNPAYGNVMTFKSAATANCTTSDTSSAAQYSLTITSKTCSLIYKTGL